ncbi:MAG: L-malate glycosyltransferase [Clostridiales bacterium]|nr:L-malate glycosyltransferase [Clostridiales bacterium]MDN5283320.1 L-malate glycosyltransferase [Candidatus Ozemobacter sp.]
MNIYFGIPSGSQVNIEEKETSRRLISAMSALPCHTRDFTTDDPYPFEAVKGTPSLIHAFNVAKAGIQCLKLAEKSRLPLVISCSGLDVYADIFIPGLKAQLQETFAGAARIIVPYPSMARFIKARIQANLNFEVISPGVLPVSNDFDFPRENFGLEEQDRIILLEGGMLPAKNLLFAIHSLDKIAADYPNLKLVMFDQPFDTNYRKKVEIEASTRPWVKILPRPESEILPFVYKMAEIAINVSHAEGYNPFLLNMMATGRPVLASDIHGNNAYIRNEAIFAENGNGYLYSTSPGPSTYEKIHDAEDFSEKLKYLLDNPDKAREIGDRAKATVTKGYSTQKEIYLHLQLYKSIIS